MKILQQGAEAIIYLDENNHIIKNRVKKSYRLPVLDEKLRKSRTRAEAKIIEKLYSVIDVPRIFNVEEKDKNIIMEFVDGKKLSDYLEELEWKDICKKIGEAIVIFHNKNIIHGDLTTSNMIYKDNKIFLIDFGLGFHSNKIEDKAVDLHLLKQALESKHFSIAEEAIDIILNNYKALNSNLILERIKAIEKRGRYRH